MVNLARRSSSGSIPFIFLTISSNLSKLNLWTIFLFFCNWSVFFIWYPCFSLQFNFFPDSKFLGSVECSWERSEKTNYHFFKNYFWLSLLFFCCLCDQSLPLVGIWNVSFGLRLSFAAWDDFWPSLGWLLFSAAFLKINFSLFIFW